MVTGKICLLDLAIEMAEKDFRLGLDFTASKASTILASSVASPESTPTPSSLTIASSFLSTVLLGELVSICFVLTMSILVAPSSFGLVLRIAVSCMYSFFFQRIFTLSAEYILAFSLVLEASIFFIVSQLTDAFFRNNLSVLRTSFARDGWLLARTCHRSRHWRADFESEGTRYSEPGRFSLITTCSKPLIALATRSQFIPNFLTESRRIVSSLPFQGERFF
mmetsp:Transcript_17385/g.35920  ORF Transcript_17385/g.35920 Transcript_17385/m.35920 type:complete len:222 (-) Transcript_17385:440-1105(-)